MAFGQAAGPPASQRDVDSLAELLAARGYDSFKEARHPFGLNQRQAAGRFTGPEAAELIQQLEADAEAGIEGPPGEPALETAPPSRATRQAAAAAAAAAATKKRPRPAARRAVRPTADLSAERRRIAQQEETAATFAAEVLATELSNRGWCVIPPTES